MPNRREAAAVDGAGAVGGEGALVEGGAIAGVALEAVFGVVARVGIHPPVAGDFGEDRGRRDGERNPIAADDGPGGAGKWLGVQLAVDQGEIGGDRQGLDGAAAPVSEQKVLDLEVEAFVSLCGEEKTQARMQYFLLNNKPLRN